MRGSVKDRVGVASGQHSQLVFTFVFAFVFTFVFAFMIAFVFAFVETEVAARLKKN